jgi:hypothetical protein
MKVTRSLKRRLTYTRKQNFLVTSNPRSIIRFTFGVHTYVPCDLQYVTGLIQKRGWLRHYATSRKIVGSSPDEVDFFNVPNPSSRTVALGSTQPLTEMSTRNFPEGEGVQGLPARKADNLTAICEPIV